MELSEVSSARCAEFSTHAIGRKSSSSASDPHSDDESGGDSNSSSDRKV